MADIGKAFNDLHNALGAVDTLANLVPAVRAAIEQARVLAVEVGNAREDREKARAEAAAAKTELASTLKALEQARKESAELAAKKQAALKKAAEAFADLG